MSSHCWEISRCRNRGYDICWLRPVRPVLNGWRRVPVRRYSGPSGGTSLLRARSPSPRPPDRPRPPPRRDALLSIEERLIPSGRTPSCRPCKCPPPRVERCKCLLTVGGQRVAFTDRRSDTVNESRTIPSRSRACCRARRKCMCMCRTLFKRIPCFVGAVCSSRRVFSHNTAALRRDSRHFRPHTPNSPNSPNPHSSTAVPDDTFTTDTK